MAKVDSETKFQNSILRTYRRFVKDFEGIVAKYEKILRKELNYIADSTIDAFYEDYDPNSYSRHGDMYNTYKITVKRDRCNIEYDIKYSPDYMQFHGELKDYLFDIVFEEGWHGGAVSGEGHPEPGIPWYRDLYAINMAKGFDYDVHPAVFWLRRAERSESPYVIMDREMDEYISKWGKMLSDETDKLIDEVIEKFKTIVKNR